MKYELQYRLYSERAILIEWPAEIDEGILEDVLNFKNKILKSKGKVIIEVISAYNSLLVFYDKAIENVYDEVLMLKELYFSVLKCKSNKKKLWYLPVCYSVEIAQDLRDFSEQKSLTIDAVIDLHTKPIYKVFFIGFLPGFLYLGGLDKKLFLDRKKTPSAHVQKGAVAIGGSQTGIYPADSPGGWHAIGACPLDFFNPKTPECCYISPGDAIKFISIKENQYNDIKSKVENKIFHPEFKIL